MKCPICIEVELLLAEREGVAIDYCPRCRGIWLDRGELDKIIERSWDWYADEPDYIPEKPKRGHPTSRRPPTPSSPPHRRRKKRKSFLKEIADWLDDLVD